MSSLYEEVGDALRGDRLYVHSDAEQALAEGGVPFGADAQASVRGRLAESPEDIFIAVLPQDAISPTTADEISRAAGQRGTYLVFAPNAARVSRSDQFPSMQVRNAASAALEGAGTPEEAALNFIGAIETMGSGGDQSGATGGRGRGGGMLPLAVLAAVGAGGMLYYRRNKRDRERAELAQVKPALEEDITAYGEELTGLDLDVRTRAIPAESQAEYARALDLYEVAKDAAERVETAAHIRPVTTALEEGRWLLSRVQARLNGETPPDRRPPCFFDPRHGPSVEDIAWAPAGGVPRAVPACAADATRIRDGHDPDSRLVTVDGVQRPYWEAGPAYSAWAGGYYGAVLPAMLVGTMLGSSVAHAGAYGGYGEGGGFDGGVDGGGGFDGGVDGGGGFAGGVDGGGGFDGGFDFGGW
jgi:hypothetical protein